LRLVDDHLLVGGVLNHDALGNTLTDSAEQVNSFGVLSLNDSDVDLVHDIFSGLLYLEAASELVNSSTHGHEVKLVVLGASTTDVKYFGSTLE